jgi:hypothetical protein
MRGGALADGSATPTVDTFYSKHLVSIGLCALVNLSYCLFYSNPLTVPSLAFYVALIAFYLRSPSVGKRLQLLGSLFVCSVTTICLLASIGFDFDVLPGEFFLVTKNELCGVYLVLWVWSYTRLGSTLIRIKSMEFFLFLSAVLLPLVLLVFYDLLQKLDSDIPAAALVAYLVVSVPSLVQPIY